MTSNGATGDVPRRSGAAPGTPTELELLLAEAAVGATEAVGGFSGGVYLRSDTEGLLRLAVMTGLPSRLFRPWWRVHVNRPFPAAQVFRSGRPVYLADAEEAMRRFPQLMVSLPFPFSGFYAPVGDGNERFGVLAVLRAVTPRYGGAAAARRDDRVAQQA
ncbi:diguanylate cyclase, partial [Streptomyces sp. NPDC058953]